MEYVINFQNDQDVEPVTASRSLESTEISISGNRSVGSCKSTYITTM